MEDGAVRRIGFNPTQFDYGRKPGSWSYAGDGYDTAVVYNNLIEPLWLSEGPVPALETCQEAIEFTERRGLGEGTAWIRSATLIPLLDLGRWDEAMDAASSFFLKLIVLYMELSYIRQELFFRYIKNLDKSRHLYPGAIALNTLKANSEQLLYVF